MLDLIQKPTAKESATVNQFKTEGGSVVREYCPHLTKEDCRMCAILSETLFWHASYHCQLAFGLLDDGFLGTAC